MPIIGEMTTRQLTAKEEQQWRNNQTDADRTYLPSEYLRWLRVEVTDLRYDVAGVGSPNLEYTDFVTRLRLTQEGQERILPVELGIFTHPATLDYPVLGADVLDQFTIILDRSHKLVVLLDPDEPYTFG